MPLIEGHPMEVRSTPNSNWLVSYGRKGEFELVEIVEIYGSKKVSNARGHTSGPGGRRRTAFIGGCLSEPGEGFKTNPGFLA